MTDIEDEVRRRILAERNADGSRPDNAPSPPVSDTDEAQPYYAAPALPKNASFLQRKKHQGGIVGALASLLLLLAKIGAPILALLGKLKFLFLGLKLLTFGKLLLTFGSMLLSMWFYAGYYGWPFGIGAVLLIFVHECGHAFASWRRGIPVSLMLFIPFLAAFTVRRQRGHNVAEDAYIAIMGPVFGAIGGLFCLGIFALTGSSFWVALAVWSFFLNLFNLMPAAMLDGGRIATLFSGKLLLIGLILLMAVAWPNPYIWVFVFLSLPRVIRGWEADPKAEPYYQSSPADKWKFGVAYFGLAALLGVGYLIMHSYLLTHHPVIA